MTERDCPHHTYAPLIRLQAVPGTAMKAQSEALTPDKLVVDGYEVHSVLGGGGYGEVYRATQKATGQQVALKVMRQHPGHVAEEASRFRREMDLCARLHHPHIVRLIDSGKLPDGRLYIVFEFIPGQDLATVLREEGSLSPTEAAHVMGQVLDALSAAHKQGIVHRDLKPSNIMLTTTGTRRNAMVLDFGVGRFIPNVDSDLAALTGESAVVGTPLYAAPEQLLGLPATPAVDLYTWGLVYLECLTGEIVMSSKTPVETIYKQLSPESVPIPPFIAHHPLGLLLRKVTAKDLSERTISAEDLLRELERLEMGNLSATLRSSGFSGIGPTRVAPTQRTPDARSASGAYGWRTASAERRQVTVVGCARDGGIDPEVDPEDCARLTEQFHSVCSEVAAEHRGRIETRLDDRVLIHFGAAQAEEDDPVRAVRTAVQAVEKLPGLRVAVHSGVVLVPRALGASEPPAIVGLTPTIAFRLCEAAPPGAILLSDAVLGILQDRVSVDAEHQSVELDGVAQAIGCRLLRGEAQPRSITQRLHTQDLPLIGRHQEISVLRQGWRSSREGEGRAILVAGEPGVGKSRLVSEMVRDVERVGGQWLECLCTPEAQHSVLQPFADLLERLIGTGGASTSSRLEALRSFLESVDVDTDKTVAVLGPLLGISAEGCPAPDVSPSKLRRLTFEALVSLLTELSCREPLLLVVEDLHWADPSTVEVINLLVSEAATAPLCVVLTARPTFKPTWAGTLVTHLPLSPFGREDTAALARSLARGKDLPDEIINLVVRRTDGVCLFVEELMRLLLASGSLEERPDRFELAGALDEHGVPPSLRSLLASRLDSMGDAKRTAQWAAVVGGEFSRDLLARLSPLSSAELDQHMNRLGQADLVRPRRRRGRVQYQFKHVMVQQTAYESLPREQRQKAHERIANVLASEFPEFARSRPEELARHFSSANDRARAIEYAIQASRMALARSANSEALVHATRAREWLEAIENHTLRAERELELNNLMNPALMATRGWADPEIKTNALRSLELIDKLGDSVHIFPTLWALSTYYHVLADHTMACQVAERLRELAERAHDEDRLAAITPTLAACDLGAGQFDGARDHFLRALELYDASRHADHGIRYGLDTKAYAKMMLAFDLTFLGYPDQALVEAEEAVDWARHTGHAATLALAMLYVAMVRAMRWEPQATAEAAAAGIAVATERGLPAQQAYCALLHAWGTGNAEAMAQTIAVLESMNSELGLPFYRSLLATLEAARGRFDEALRWLDRALERSRATGDVYFTAGILGLKARTLFQQGPGNADRAEDILNEAISTAERQNAKAFELFATIELCRILDARGERSEAKRRLGAIYGWFTEGHETPALRDARELLRRLDAAEGTAP